MAKMIRASDATMMTLARLDEQAREHQAQMNLLLVALFRAPSV